MGLKLPKRLKQHPSIHRSRIQEEELAFKVGGRKTLASGALDVKGDVRLKRVVRIEAKTTSADSFRVTREMISKIEEAAVGADELPAFIVEFNNATGSPVKSVAVVPMYVLEMIADFKQ